VPTIRGADSSARDERTARLRNDPKPAVELRLSKRDEDARPPCRKVWRHAGPWDAGADAIARTERRQGSPACENQVTAFRKSQKTRSTRLAECGARGALCMDRAEGAGSSRRWGRFIIFCSEKGLGWYRGRGHHAGAERPPREGQPAWRPVVCSIGLVALMSARSDVRALAGGSSTSATGARRREVRGLWTIATAVRGIFVDISPETM